MGAWQDELPFIDELLTEGTQTENPKFKPFSDLRNNSAWNHRFFVVTQQTPVGNRQREIDYAIAYIRKAVCTLAQVGTWLAEAVFCSRTTPVRGRIYEGFYCHQKPVHWTTLCTLEKWKKLMFFW